MAINGAYKQHAKGCVCVNKLLLRFGGAILSVPLTEYKLVFIANLTSFCSSDPVEKQRKN